ncbi:MAG: DUF3324 domain-containing protein [Lachnospiraceae bacterium]|nr:DUF3324 domain-containing protein [Lachnospiraceae bacterium]
MTKLFKKALSLALAVVVLLTPMANSYAANSLKTDVDNINSKIAVSQYQRQITRYKTNGNKAAGQCNICAITNLLNRRLVFDGVALSGNKFDFEYVFYESCMYYSSNNLTVEKCKTNSSNYPFDSSSGIIKSDSDSDGYLYGPIYQSGSKKYKLTKYTGTYNAQNIAALLDSHHEGIFIRCKYDGGGHCVVLYNYEKDSNGNYTFYSIDTANGSDTSHWQGKFSDSYLGGKYYNGTRVSPSYQGCIDVVMYLESTSTNPKMSQATFFDRAVSLSFNNVPNIGTINKGSSYNLTGTVSSTAKITNFKGEIFKNGSVVQSYNYNPNSTSVNIKSSPVNTNLRFGQLAAGSYTLKYTATSVGKTFTCTRSFTVAAPALTISMTSAPTTINYGSSFNLAGTITSGYNITKVVGQIKSGNTVKQTQTINPNTTSVDIKSSKINANLRFGTLAKGSYTLVITATDSSGATKTYSKSFTVK